MSKSSTNNDALLLEFIELDLAGNEPDPTTFLERADSESERAELVDLIDAYLDQAPGRAFDPARFSGSVAELTAERLYRSLAGVSGRWPSVLPTLRERARMHRDELAAKLSEALGLGAERERVGQYLHGMEHGSLPAEGVSEKVINALAGILGVDADTLRGLGSAAGGSGPAGGPVFARRSTSVLEVTSQMALDQDSSMVADEDDPEGWDEVDRLFRAGD